MLEGEREEEVKRDGKENREKGGGGGGGMAGGREEGGECWVIESSYSTGYETFAED